MMPVFEQMPTPIYGFLNLLRLTIIYPSTLILQKRRQRIMLWRRNWCVGVIFVSNKVCKGAYIMSYRFYLGLFSLHKRSNISLLDGQFMPTLHCIIPVIMKSLHNIYAFLASYMAVNVIFRRNI